MRKKFKPDKRKTLISDAEIEREIELSNTLLKDANMKCKVCGKDLDDVIRSKHNPKRCKWCNGDLDENPRQRVKQKKRSTGDKAELAQ